jgi:hypothetical protein
LVILFGGALQMKKEKLQKKKVSVKMYENDNLHLTTLPVAYLINTVRYEIVVTVTQA